MFSKNIDEENRQVWLKKTLSALPRRLRILDAGAGELKKVLANAKAGYITYSKVCPQPGL